GVGFNFLSISIDGDLTVTWQHGGCACNDILNVLAVDLSLILDVSLGGLSCNSQNLYSPAVPRGIADASKPEFNYKVGEGGTSGD
ncbi:hypothetical protein, partial [Ciceribacter ferrooxidans]|uniref:hypothetical protein n=1 Tax=Ciceribacter ferrooxidans TaxID=2509717 RepID=UPI00196B843D